MKTKLITFSFLIIASTAFSQVDKKLKQTLSVNANFLLDQWFSRSSELNILEVEPDHVVLVMYKVRNQKTDWRIGAGGTFQTEELEISTPFSFTPLKTINTHRGYVLQLGVQGNKGVWKNWEFIYGGDVLLQHRKFRAELEITPDVVFNFGNVEESWSQYKQNSIGLSGFMGVQFYITERIALSTEFALIFSQTFNSEDGESDSFFGLAPNNFVSSLNIDREDRFRFASPLTLFINFRF